MKKSIIVLFSIFFATQMFSQRNFGTVVNEYLRQYQFDKTTKIKDIDLETLNYVGSPYANERFTGGEIYHNNKLIAENVPLRYNALMDEVEFKPSFETPDKDSKALMKTPDIDIRIGQQVFIFVPYQGGLEKGGYFEVLVKDDKYDLFKKYNKKYSEERKAQTSMTRDIPAKFTDNPEYFLISPSGSFYQLNIKKKGFTKVFSEKQSQVDAFIKENKLDERNENHLIEIVKYFNSL